MCWLEESYHHAVSTAVLSAPWAGFYSLPWFRQSPRVCFLSQVQRPHVIPTGPNDTGVSGGLKSPRMCVWTYFVTVHLSWKYVTEVKALQFCHASHLSRTCHQIIKAWQHSSKRINPYFHKSLVPSRELFFWSNINTSLYLMWVFNSNFPGAYHTQTTSIHNQSDTAQQDASPPTHAWTSSSQPSSVVLSQEPDNIINLSPLTKHLDSPSAFWKIGKFDLWTFSAGVLVCPKQPIYRLYRL